MNTSAKGRRNVAAPPAEARNIGTGGVMPTKRTSALTMKLLGRDVELTCRCGFVLTQPLRAAIDAQCPKCGRRWRR